MFRRTQNIRLLCRRFSSPSSLPPTIRQVLDKSFSDNVPAEVTVHGWVKSIRRQKKVTFIAVNDGSTLQGLQAVFLHPTGDGVDTLANISTGASIRVAGKLIKSRGTGQEKELQAKEIELLGLCDPLKYPIQKKEHSLEFFRENMHLRPRTSNIAAMLRVRNKMTQYFSDWYQKAGFIQVHPPSLTSNDCENAGEAYKVMSQAKHAQEEEGSLSYLTTSTQLHLEALSASFARVFTIAPCFRAERSQTNRHLNEFWMLEAEISFLRGLPDLCNILETSLKSVLGELTNDEDVQYLREESTGREQFDAWLDHSVPWSRISYTEALNKLQQHHISKQEPQFAFEPPAWGEAIRSEHERWIAATLGANGQPGPVFVTDYPRHLKPFYMWVNKDTTEGSTVSCFDLLVPKLGELVGGSIRESREEILKESLRLFSMSEEHNSWYLDIRRYGSTPHGGYGVGFERLVSWFCGIENVRECIPFPRWAGKTIL